MLEPSLQRPTRAGLPRASSAEPQTHRPGMGKSPLHRRCVKITQLSQAKQRHLHDVEDEQGPFGGVQSKDLPRERNVRALPALVLLWRHTDRSNVAEVLARQGDP